jgi:hypothetical protein
MNYEAIILSTDKYGMETRQTGDTVYIHIFENGSVLAFSPASKTQRPLDVIFTSTLEAKRYLKCTKKSTMDVKTEWNKLMNKRYF